MTSPKSTSKVIAVPATFIDAVARLIESAPTPTDPKDRAAIAKGKRIIAKVRKTRIGGDVSTRRPSAYNPKLMSPIEARNEIQLAWCAGIFDGQGSVGIYGPRVTVRMTITTLAALKGAQKAVGAGNIRPATKRPPRRQAWTWAVTSQPDCARVLKLLRPFLIVKRHDADAAIAYLTGEISADAGRERLQHRRTRRGPTALGRT